MITADLILGKEPKDVAQVGAARLPGSLLDTAVLGTARTAPVIGVSVAAGVATAELSHGSMGLRHSYNRQLIGN